MDMNIHFNVEKHHMYFFYITKTSSTFSVLLIKASFHKQIIRKKLELIVLVIQKKILYANAISGFIDPYFNANSQVK